MTIYIIWLLLSLGLSSVIIHKIGSEYGDYVAMSLDTRIAIFMATATSVGLFIGFVKWLAL